MLWEDSTITDLGTLGGHNSRATSINEEGQIVGRSETSSGVEHAFLWENGSMIDLGTHCRLDVESYATSINEQGQIVGSSETAEGEQHAFLWENGEMMDLSSRGESTRATSINDKGQVIVAVRGRGTFLWEEGTFIEFGFSIIEINNKGQIVGHNEEREYFIWDNGTTTEIPDIPDIPGVEDERIGAITSFNDVGQIAGEIIGRDSSFNCDPSPECRDSFVYGFIMNIND